MALHSTPSKGRVLTGNILIYLAGVALAGSAASKFAHVPAVAAQMAMLGFAGNKLMFVATLEIAGALLLMIPKTRPFGLLFVSAYLGGAVASHIGHAQDAAAFNPAIVLGLIWLGTWLRHPQVYWSAD